MRVGRGEEGAFSLGLAAKFGVSATTEKPWTAKAIIVGRDRGAAVAWHFATCYTF